MQAIGVEGRGGGSGCWNWKLRMGLATMCVVVATVKVIGTDFLVFVSIYQF